MSRSLPALPDLAFPSPDSLTDACTLAGMLGSDSAHQVAGVESKVKAGRIKVGLAVRRELVRLCGRVPRCQLQVRGLRELRGAAQVDGRLLRRVAVGRSRAAGPGGRAVCAVAPASDVRATVVSAAPRRCRASSVKTAEGVGAASGRSARAVDTCRSSTPRSPPGGQAGLPRRRRRRTRGRSRAAA